MAKKSQWDTAVIDVNQKKVAKQVLSNKKPLRDSWKTAVIKPSPTIEPTKQLRVNEWPTQKISPLFNTSNEITVDDNTISSNTYLFVILKDLLALIFFILAILMGVNSYWIVQIKHDAITQIGNKTNDAIIAFAVIAFVNVSLLLFHFIISLWVKQKSKNKKYLCKTICLYTIQTLIFLVLGAVAIYFRVSIDEIPALGFTNRILLICGYGLTWLIVFVLYICYINVTQAKLNVVENKKEGNK